MIIPKILKQRSSWPSSFVTGLIGWNGLTIIAALAFAYPGPLGPLFLIATGNAVTQVTVLRLFFFTFGMEKGVWRGVFWGTVTAGLLIATEKFTIDLVHQNFLVAMLTGLYIGGPVGAFLSYFYRDDREIENEKMKAELPIDYGRDAHWLDPFLYGAIAYFIVFVPRSVDLGLSAFVVGSFTGVVAAGVSHFFLSRWDNAAWTMIPATIAGVVFGGVTGLLFRNFSSQLFLPPLTVGALAGGVTFFATACVGRLFARRERGEAS